jgi:hypothetical protein
VTISSDPLSRLPLSAATDGIRRAKPILCWRRLFLTHACGGLRGAEPAGGVHLGQEQV